MIQKTTVVLLATHTLKSFIIEQYYRISKVLTGFADVYLLVEDNDIDFSLIPDDIKYYIFSTDSLNQLNYEPIAETIVPGSNHFPVLQFYNDFPAYDYYWNIEYDVYFTGDWRFFFDSFQNINADFISSHIERYHQRPSWLWWNSIKFTTFSIPVSDYIKSFNPIYRISQKALESIHQVLSTGNLGHHEVLIPTILNYLGYSLLDLGACGDFSYKNFDKPLYLSFPGLDDAYTCSTMRFRPLFTKENVDKSIGLTNKLFHPVKN